MVNLTLGLSIPIPKALVATIIGILLSRNLRMFSIDLSPIVCPSRDEPEKVPTSHIELSVLELTSTLIPEELTCGQNIIPACSYSALCS